MTASTTFDENSGILKEVSRDGNTLAAAAADVKEKYQYGALGGRNLVAASGTPGSKSEYWSSGVLKGKTVVAGGSFQWSGGLTTKAVTITGLLSTDYAYAEIINSPTQASKITDAAVTADTLTVTLDVANTSNDAIVTYVVYR